VTPPASRILYANSAAVNNRQRWRQRTGAANNQRPSQAAREKITLSSKSNSKTKHYSKCHTSYPPHAQFAAATTCSASHAFVCNGGGWDCNVATSALTPPQPRRGSCNRAERTRARVVWHDRSACWGLHNGLTGMRVRDTSPTNRRRGRNATTTQMRLLAQDPRNDANKVLQRQPRHPHIQPSFRNSPLHNQDVVHVTCVRLAGAHNSVQGQQLCTGMCKVFKCRTSELLQTRNTCM